MILMIGTGCWCDPICRTSACCSVDQTFCGNSLRPSVESSHMRIGQGLFALELFLFQSILFVFACRFRLHKTLETFPADTFQLCGIRIEFSQDLPCLFVHKFATWPGCLLTAPLKIMMFTQNITVCVGPWWRHIRQSAIALALLLLGELFAVVSGGRRSTDGR
jgi:hypothetical protein